MIPQRLPDSRARRHWKGNVLTNRLRRFIISRPPIAECIAKKAYERMYTAKKLKSGDFSMRRGEFEAAKGLYQDRGNWLGMSIAQLRMGDTDGAIKTLNEKYLFSKGAAALFIRKVVLLDGVVMAGRPEFWYLRRANIVPPRAFGPMLEKKQRRIGDADTEIYRIKQQKKKRARRARA
jgi:hypothetical protein